MDIEALFGSFVRRLNQPALTVAAAGSGLTLPAPKTDKRYVLYLHVPHCIALCPFCSFHSVEFEHESGQQYFECLRREIALMTDAGYRFDDVYIGGGTPTVLPAELVRTIEAVREAHPVANVAVETNADRLESAALQPLARAGVNRLSVGVQSFDDTLLEAMQRLDLYGSGDEMARRLTAVRGMFETVNVDMMFNLPRQTEASLRRDLDVLIERVAADQVSFYPLMTDDSNSGAIFRSMGPHDPSRQKARYRLIAERMSSAGYGRASAWCFARAPGTFDEYITGREEYVGLGSGAFSYLDGALYSNTFSIAEYLQMLHAGKNSAVGRRSLSEHDQKRYFLLVRLFSGKLDVETAEARFGGGFRRSLWPELAALSAIGAVRDRGESLTLTERGYYLWVVLMREFFSETNRLRHRVRH